MEGSWNVRGGSASLGERSGKGFGGWTNRGGSIVGRAKAEGVPVLRFAVTTEFAMGNTYAGHVFEDIGVFSDAAKRLVE